VKELEFFNDKFNELTKLQLEALDAEKEPLAVTGMPGSGKSLLALAKLRRTLEEKVRHNKKGRLLYVTASEKLKRKMQKMREKKDPSFDVNDTAKIEFKTYDELLKEFLPEIVDKTTVGKKDFTAWLNNLNWWKNKDKKGLKNCLTECLPKG